MSEQIAEIENEQPEGEEPKTFSEDYVKELRQEAAANRTQANAYREALRSYALDQGCSGVLVEPLEWDDEFNDENGLPDPLKISEAAKAVALERPHLAKVSTPIPQGPQGEETAPFSITAAMRG